MSLRLSSWLPRLRLAALAGAAALALTACGGDVYNPFKPARILSVGDEYSYIDATSGATRGAKYTINALNGDNTFNCGAYLLWNQYVAQQYGFTFQECQGTDTRARALAKEGAKAADVAAQLEAAGALQDKDLVLVQVGANDVWELFAQHTAGGDLAGLKNEANRRGAALAAQLHGWTGQGARVVVLDVMNQGQTPEAAAAAATAPNAPTALQELSTAFNDGLRGGLTGNVRKIAMILANNLVSEAIDNKNYDHPKIDACTEAAARARDCTTATLKAGVDPNPNNLDYVFAKGRYLTPNINLELGELAHRRAEDHPF